MEELYDFRKHTHCILIHIRKENICAIISNMFSDNNFVSNKRKTIERACITYDKKKEKVISFGNDLYYGGVNDDHNNGVYVDNFLDGLNFVAKKKKDTWNGDDEFLIKAISDFLNLLVKKTIKDAELEHVSLDLLHYGVIVPSEWEEEVKEDLIRCIFTETNLISKDDHRDRVVISSDLECIFNCRMYDDYDNPLRPKRGENIIMCKQTRIDDNAALVNFYLVAMSHTRFDFADSQLYPTVKRSNSIIITADAIKSCIRSFLQDNLFPNSKNGHQIIEMIANQIYYNLDVIEDYEEISFMVPIIINTCDEWELSNTQKAFLNSLNISDICTVFDKPFFKKIKNEILGNFRKKYEYFGVVNKYDSELWTDVEIFDMWLEYIVQWNIKLSNKKSTNTDIIKRVTSIYRNDIIYGLMAIVMETIKNVNVYGLPQINQINDLKISSSLFLDGKPDTIIRIDISLNSTNLECSRLNDNISPQKIFDHEYFTKEKKLPSLQNYYNVLNVPSLTVNERFIPFAEKHLLDDLHDSFSKNVEVLNKIELILNKFQSIKNTITHQKKYMNAFLLLYFIYIKNIISSRLPTYAKFESTNMKVGFAISIEKILLDTVVGSKEDLRELIYASGLIKRDNNLSKLRITVLGERMLSSIKQLLKLNLPVKSYFVLAHIHENYIQLTLNQAVTASNSQNQQESIIVEDKIICIQNVYDSLCSYMWNHLVQNQNHVKLCKTHCNNHKEEPCSIKNKTEIISNVKKYILDNILTGTLNSQTFYMNIFTLNLSCNCKIHLTTYDIIEIAFKPLLKNINTIMLSTLINKEYFGRYSNIDYHISLIYFNHNIYFQNIIADILEKDAIICNPIRGIDAICMVIPAFKVQPFSPEEFQTGALYQVYNENYVFSFDNDIDLYFKRKREDKKKTPFDENLGYYLLKKDSILSHHKLINEVCVYNSGEDKRGFSMKIYRYKTSGDLKDEVFSVYDKSWEKVLGYTYYFAIPGKTVPVKIIIEHIGYSSSIRLSTQVIGNGENFIDHEISVPMTLIHY